MMTLRYLPHVLILLTLVACASAPKQTSIQSEIDIPRAWTDVQPISAKIDSAWWSEFNAVQLDTILNRAFAQNYDLRIAAARLQSAAAQAKIAGAPLYPQADLSLDGARRKQNFIGFPIPGQEGGVLSTTTSSYGVSLNLSWELDLWDRLGAEKAAAVSELQAAQADLVGARLSLTAQVAKIWFAAIEAKRQLELSEATVDSWQLSTEQVKRRYEGGLVSSLDYRLALSNLALAEANLSINRSRYQSILRQLEILLGEYPSADIVVTDDLPSPTMPVPMGLPADLISRRPDLAAAERRLAADNARIASARAQLYPRLSLTGSGGTASNELGDLLKGDFSIWGIVGNLTQPIFQGGRLRAGVELAKSTAEASLAQYANTALRAFGDVENALADEGHLDTRVAALSEATEQAVAARQLAETQYSRGLVDVITMLEAQRSAYNSESQLLLARRERLDARVDLYMALGGGFTVHTSDN
ncbi:efflux transporter outer membrane subunit [bacterium]|nr:efflux transporter outer membrane subunit [bacterium]